MIILIGSILTLVGANRVKDSQLKQAFELKSRENDEILIQTKGRIEQVFGVTYDTLRTIAMLPGVSSIDRYAKKFQIDAKLSVQQLYNNIASHVSVSEVYIVPAEFEPDVIDPVTKKLQTPMITFDEVIVGKSNQVKTAKESKENAPSKLEEVEIFEYREMKKQNTWFKENYPTISQVDGMKYPALTSSEVITCDNAEFNSELLKKGDDTKRKGILYSVPFYGPDGKYKGLITAVFRTSVLEKVLGLPLIGIQKVGSNYKIGNILDLKTENKYQIHQSQNLDIKDKDLWSISFFQSPELFLTSSAYSNVQFDFTLMLMMGLLITVMSAWGFFILTTTRDRAINLAKKMTRIAEERQIALIQSSKMASLGEMASGIAHEINNPLSIILGKIASLQRNMEKNGVDKETVLASLQRVSNAAERIAKIVNSLRSFSRKSDSDPMAPAELKKIVEDSLELCAEKIKNTGVSLRLPEVIPDVTLRCRQGEITQVLINLISNACDAIEVNEEKWVELSFAIDENNVKFKVTDSGKGIPVELQDRLMEPFFTTKDVGKGTGLGLSISKKIIEDHEGIFLIDNKSPNTQFVFTVPRVKY